MIDRAQRGLSLFHSDWVSWDCGGEGMGTGGGGTWNSEGWPGISLFISVELSFLTAG